MTPEQRAAAKRLRRAVDERSVCEAYQLGFTEAMRQFQADESLLARAYLAEHPADDGEPVTLEEVAEVLTPNIAAVAVMEGVGTIAWINDHIAIQTRGQLRALLKGLGR